MTVYYVTLRFLRSQRIGLGSLRYKNDLGALLPATAVMNFECTRAGTIYNVANPYKKHLRYSNGE